MELGSLIRATNLWGYTDLMRELGADPLPFLRRFDIPPGIEHQEDAFMSLAGFVRMLEASAAELDCPDFGLRLARWQGLGILGPVAVIARNAATLFGGLEAIGRYLYVHSPALTLTVSSTTARSNVRFGYEVTEPGIPYPLQGYELSMANAARMIACWADRRRGRAFSRSDMRNWAPTPPTAKRWVVPFGSAGHGAGSRWTTGSPVGPSTMRIRKPSASPRNIWNPNTFRAMPRSPSGSSGWPAACCRPANAAPRPSPTNSTCTHERCSGAWLPRASGAMTSSSANAVRKRQGTSPNRGCI